VTTICLVRHGEADRNRDGRLQGREDTDLNDQGRMQARRTAEHLAREDWDLIATSPLRRATETAAIIAARIGDLPVVQMPELVERDYGAASGLTAEERRALYPDDCVPGIEPPASVRARAVAVLEELATEYPSRRILVVGHGGIINAMLSVLSDGEIGTGKTILRNACLSMIHRRDRIWEIESHNVTSHL
jgi:uncharacterized phosphatase